MLLSEYFLKLLDTNADPRIAFIVAQGYAQLHTYTNLFSRLHGYNPVAFEAAVREACESSSPVFSDELDDWPHLFNEWLLASAQHVIDNTGPEHGQEWFEGKFGVRSGFRDDLQDTLDWFYAITAEGSAEPPQRWPRTFREADQLVAAWHASLADKKRSGKPPGAGQIVMSFEDGWTVRQLETRTQLEGEGHWQGHCVGGTNYVEALRTGDFELYSLRDENNHPQVTIELQAVSRAMRQWAMTIAGVARKPISTYYTAHAIRRVIQDVAAVRGTSYVGPMTMPAVVRALREIRKDKSAGAYAQALATYLLDLVKTHSADPGTALRNNIEVLAGLHSPRYQLLQAKMANNELPEEQRVCRHLIQFLSHFNALDQTSMRDIRRCVERELG